MGIGGEPMLGGTKESGQSRIQVFGGVFSRYPSARFFTGLSSFEQLVVDLSYALRHLGPSLSDASPYGKEIFFSELGGKHLAGPIDQVVGLVHEKNVITAVCFEQPS
jgi:hypothetical protein